MPQPEALIIQDTATSPHLLAHETADVFARDIPFYATERLPIRQSGMGADDDTVLLRERGRSPYQISAAGMSAAGDVHRRNEWHQCGVEGQPFGGLALTHVTVEIKPAQHKTSGRTRPHQSDRTPLCRRE